MLTAVKKLGRLAAALVLLALLSWAGPRPAAGNALAEVKLPEALEPGIQHLFSLLASPTSSVFQPATVAPVLAFVREPKPGNTLYFADTPADLTSAYHQFDIACSLGHMLRYAFNPEVPGYLLMPSSIRYSLWSEVDGRPQPLPRLWEAAITPGDFHLVRGVEQVEITPDLFTGAYYRYTTDNLLILSHHEGRRVMISLSKQQRPSEVGKRGLVLGGDAEWNYLYTGQPGLEKAGLGWVKSHMYDSLTLMVHYELDPQAPLLRCATFKWLRAGWADLNFVRKPHIYRGLERFGKDFKELLETPLLPKPEEIGRVTAGFKNLPMTALRETARDHFASLQTRYGRGDEDLHARIETVLSDDRYLNQMKREELEAILVKTYLKCLVGKKPAPGPADRFCRELTQLVPQRP
jgi:hypothetical protein